MKVAPKFARRLRLGRGAILAMLVLPVATLIGGCAHPLAIGPDIAKIERDADSQPIDRNVGYYIAPDLRDRAVTTPGGGGDSVTYSPYRDMEAAFYKMLGNVFKNVTLLKSPKDAATIASKSISYVITPEIKTDSSSPSPFTWPPTTFIVTLSCDITDASGNKVAKPTVTAAGRAEFDEFKSDFSLSAKRASLEAMLKMQSALLRLPELKNP